MRPTLSLTLVLGLTTLTGPACKSSMDPSLPAGDVSIVPNASTMGSAAFSPDPFTESFPTRAQVIWVNADQTTSVYGGTTGTPHHLVSDIGLFDSGLLSPGKSYPFTFAASGTYTYHCVIHPTMVGTITLTP
jgi:plastocyanin